MSNHLFPKPNSRNYTQATNNPKRKLSYTNTSQAKVISTLKNRNAMWIAEVQDAPNISTATRELCHPKGQIN